MTQELERRLVNGLLGQGGQMDWSHVAGVLVATVILWHLIPTPILAGWSALVAGAAGFRRWVGARSAAGGVSPAARVRAFRAATFGLGLAWSAGSVFAVARISGTELGVLAGIVCIFVAGGTGTIGWDLPSFDVFAASTLGPLALALALLSPDRLHWQMAGSLVVFGVLVKIVANRSHNAVVEQVQTGIAAEQAQVALRRSEARLSDAQSVAHFGSWELDLDNLFNLEQSAVWWSDEVYRILGYSPGEVTPSVKLFFDSVHQSDLGKIRGAVVKTLHDGVPFLVEHRIVRRDGTERVVLQHATLVEEAGSKEPARMVGTMLDITAVEELARQVREVLGRS